MVENGTKVTMRDVTIVFRNFSGEPDRFNPQGGKRGCSVLLDDSTAEAMLEDGWNVKYLKPREDDEDQVSQAFLPVTVRYDVRPPRIFMVTDRGRTLLKEDLVGQLDGVDIRKVDMIISASVWQTPDKSGIKAYVQSMYVTIEEDELEQEYGELPQQ